MSVLPGLAQSRKVSKKMGAMVNRLSFLPPDDPVEQDRKTPRLDELMKLIGPDGRSD